MRDLGRALRMGPSRHVPSLQDMKVIRKGYSQLQVLGGTMDKAIQSVRSGAPSSWSSNSLSRLAHRRLSSVEEADAKAKADSTAAAPSEASRTEYEVSSDDSN
jgi:hypothetical protein